MKLTPSVNGSREMKSSPIKPEIHNEDEVYCIKVNDELASKIEIRRYGEVDGGFQRKLRTDVLSKIVRKARLNEAIPPIVLAKCEAGKFRLLDGQHRFEAWKQEHYELWAQVTPMRPQKAVESFCTINSTSRRIQLKHQLNVDPSAYAVKLREISDKYKIPNNAIHGMCTELIQQHDSGRNIRMEPQQWKAIEGILELWTKDKRWEQKSQIYNKYGTLVMVTRLCKNSENHAKMIKMLQELDYSNVGALADRYSGSYSGARVMATYALQSMARKGVLA